MTDLTFRHWAKKSRAESSHKSTNGINLKAHRFSYHCNLQNPPSPKGNKMARPKFLSRNNDNAPVVKRKADDDNVAPKHVSVPHKAQALQDLIDDSSNARPHVLYLQSLGILPASFNAKAETSASPSWAGSTTSSSSYSFDSASFVPQANNSALGFISYLGISRFAQ